MQIEEINELQQMTSQNERQNVDSVITFLVSSSLFKYMDAMRFISFSSIFLAAFLHNEISQNKVINPDNIHTQQNNIDNGNK